MSGPKNTLNDLNNLLFEQLERLNDVEGEDLTREIERSKAVSNIARNIIDNGKLVLDAEKFTDDRFNVDKKMPRMLIGIEDDEQPKKK